DGVLHHFAIAEVMATDPQRRHLDPGATERPLRDLAGLGDSSAGAIGGCRLLGGTASPSFRLLGRGLASHSKSQAGPEHCCRPEKLPPHRLDILMSLHRYLLLWD